MSRVERKKEKSEVEGVGKVEKETEKGNEERTTEEGRRRRSIGRQHGRSVE